MNERMNEDILVNANYHLPHVCIHLFTFTSYLVLDDLTSLHFAMVIRELLVLSQPKF